MTEISNVKSEFSNRWSFKNFLYLKEGSNTKLNTRSLKITSIVLSCIVLVYQLFSSDEKVQIRDNENFSVPINQPITTISPPPVHKEGYSYAERQAAQGKRSNPIVAAPIRSISFSKKDSIPTGTEVRALLSSGGSNGMVTATLSEPLYVEGEIVVEKGSVLYGRGNSSDERLYISFSKLIKKDKSELKIKAQAFDSKDRILGLKGSKVGNYAFKIAASSGLFFLSGMAEGLQRPENVMLPQRKSMRDAALQGVAQATVEQGREIVSNMNNKTMIEVKHSTPVIVIFDDGDLND